MTCVTKMSVVNNFADEIEGNASRNFLLATMKCSRFAIRSTIEIEKYSEKGFITLEQSCIRDSDNT